MTLKKQFQVMFNNTVPNENRVDKSIKICDDFAIEFAEWRVNDWIHDERWTKIYDMKEVLEIYKKEKGL